MPAVDGSHLHRAAIQLDRTLGELHDIAEGLHPRALDQGLATALSETVADSTHHQMNGTLKVIHGDWKPRVSDEKPSDSELGFESHHSSIEKRRVAPGDDPIELIEMVYANCSIKFRRSRRR